MCSINERGILLIKSERLFPNTKKGPNRVTGTLPTELGNLELLEFMFVGKLHPLLRPKNK